MQRAYKNRRLIYFQGVSDADHWDRVWKLHETQSLYEAAERGDLGYYEDIFLKHLPREGKILEAGCGLGQIVIALRARGFEVEGVDYATQTIQELQRRFPQNPFRVGDVTKLEAPDGFYSGYISLGVMEHLEDGPNLFLKEARRVLKKGGIACISVPYLNFLRRLKAALGFYRGEENKLPFYQYAYSSLEFSQILKLAGFEIVATYQYSGYKGTKDELPFLMEIFKWPQGWRLQKALMNSKWLDRHNGHMMMYIARRRN
jgi:SAM-dependent methyltransferase